MGGQKLSTRIPKFWILQHFSTQIRLLSLTFLSKHNDETMNFKTLMIIDDHWLFSIILGTLCNGIFADIFSVKSHNDETLNLNISRL
jgi:hypothetical protein